MHNLLYGITYMTEKKKCELCHKMVDSYLYKFNYYSHPSQFSIGYIFVLPKMPIILKKLKI